MTASTSRLFTSNLEAVTVARKVWDRYKDCDGGELSRLTHLPDSPWHKIAKQWKFRVPKNTEIPVDVVKDYYRTVVPPLPTN